jgi:hypothetical protein
MSLDDSQSKEMNHQAPRQRMSDIIHQQFWHNQLTTSTCETRSNFIWNYLTSVCLLNISL